MSEKKKKNRPGPAPEVLRIDGDWKDAVKKILGGNASAVTTKSKKAKKKQTTDGA